MKVTIQELLDKAYPIAVDVLASHYRSYIQKHRMNNSFEDHLQNLSLSDEDEALLKNIVWHPVAQEFVVTMLQPLLASPAMSDTLLLTKEDLAKKWLEDTTPEDLAQETGLVGEDVTSAMEAVAEAIYTSDIFKSPCTLFIDDKEVTITRQ